MTIAAVSATAAGLLSALTSSDTTAGSANVTRSSGEAPAFAIKGLRDPHLAVSLKHFRGRPLVINFFASWCNPCRREMPAFQSVYGDVKGSVAFLGIDTQDIRSDALDLVHETGIDYPAGFDPSGDVARSFGVLGMPTTVFISKDGKMLRKLTGETSEEQLRRLNARLFKVET